MCFPPTFIFRHRRENIKKCSLRGLETRADLRFVNYPKDPVPDLTGYILLKIDAPLLSIEDKDKGLLLLDGTWKIVQSMEKQLPVPLCTRSLPPYKTAYPRRQTACPNPEIGLASVEALFIAYVLLQRPTAGLLDFYYWKQPFLEQNALCN